MLEVDNKLKLKNAAKKILLFVVFFAFLQESFASQTFRTLKSGLWSDPNVWVAPGNEIYPGKFDNVVISSGHTITLDMSTSITRNFTIEKGGVLRGMGIRPDGTAYTLVIGKDNVDADFTNHGTLEFSGANAAHILLQYKSRWSGEGIYNLSTIDLNVSLMEFSSSSSMTLNFSDANPIINTGIINTPAAVTFNFNGTVPQYLPKNLPVSLLRGGKVVTGAITYGNIKINNLAGVNLQSNINTGNLLGDLSVLNGKLNTNGFTVSGNGSNKILVLENGYLNLNGLTTVPFPSGFASVSLHLQSTVNYSADATQEIQPAKYGNLIISGVKTSPVGINGTTITLLPLGEVECENLTLENAVVFALNQNLTVNKTVTLHGVLAVGVNNLTLNGGPLQGIMANLLTTSSSSLTFGGNSPGIFVPQIVTTLKDLTINNASSTGVNLFGNLAVSGKVAFKIGKLYLNTSNLTLLSRNSVIGNDSTRYFVTNNNPEMGGYVIQKIYNDNNYVEFPIGTEESYSPARIKLSIGSVPDDFRIRVFDNIFMQGTSGTALTTNAVKKTWLIEETVIGGSDATLSLGWLTKAQLPNFKADKTGNAHFKNGKWELTKTYTARTKDINGINWQAQGGYTDFSPFGVVDIDGGAKLVDVVVNLKVFLQGPYNTSTGLMNTSLNSLGYLPLNQPYSGAPWNHTGTESVASGFFAANPTIVDWVLLEFRTGTAASTAIKRQAAFLKNNGDIVGLDGLSLPILKDVQAGSYYVVIRHRNHVAVMSNSKIDISSASGIYNFTNDLSKFYGSDAKQLSNGFYAMHAGDANGDGTVNYGGSSDRLFIFNNLLTGNSFKVLRGVYSTGDLNLDGTVNYGASSDRLFIFNQVLLGNSFNTKRTKVPN